MTPPPTNAKGGMTMRFEAFTRFTDSVSGVLGSRAFREYVMEHQLDEDEAVIQAEAYVLDSWNDPLPGGNDGHTRRSA